MRHAHEMAGLRSGSSTPPPSVRYFPLHQREPTAEWILGLLEHEDVSTSISIDEPVLQPHTIHPMHKNKWFLRNNRYKPPLSPMRPLRRSSSTSQLDIEKVKQNNSLTMHSKPKWWSISKLNIRAKQAKSEAVDIKSGYKVNYGVHPLQNIKQRWSSRLNLLKRSLSNRVLRRQISNNVS